jgi:D-tyrosyl-tRNA(Tyr) deacylase
MRAVVQRVTSASVRVGDDLIAAIDAGLLALVGVTHDDTEADAIRLARKIAGLRILRDGDRDDVSADQLNAPVLVVSQFTLYGDASGGRRPSWQQAAGRAHAEPLIGSVRDELHRLGLPVKTGMFGAMMAVSSVNDGPFTVLIEI